MKKFMKICGITAAVLLILGIAMTFAAGSVKGARTVYQVVESVLGRKERFRSETESSGQGTVRDPDDAPFDDGDDVVSDDQEKAPPLSDNAPDNTPDNAPESAGNDRNILQGDVSEYQVGTGITQLELELDGYTLETAVSKDENYYLSAENADRVQCYLQKGVLYVKTPSAALHVNRERKLTLYLPEDARLESVDIELGAGQLTLKDLEAGEVSLEVGAGSISAENICAREVDLSVGAGLIELEGVDTDELDASIGMGSLSVSGSVNGDVDLECSMGEVTLTLAGTEQDFNYELEVTAGTLTLGDDEYSGLSHSRTLDHGARKTMEIECSMGEVIISFEG